MWILLPPLEIFQVHGKIIGSSGGRDGCTSGSGGSVQSLLHLSAAMPRTSSVVQDRGRKDPSHPGGSRLALPPMDPALASIALIRLAVESQVLKDMGLPTSMIPPLLKAQKSTSQKIYHCTWGAYMF